MKLLEKHFEIALETHDGITRLKELILKLGMQGKLDTNNSSDESADYLLKRIKKEEQKLIDRGVIKKADSFHPIKNEEFPFQIPNNWKWCRLGEITSKIGSGSTPRGGKEVYLKSGIVFLRSQNIYNEGLLLDDIVYIDEQTNNKMSNTVVAPFDILLNITGGSLGRCTLFKNYNFNANVSQHVTIIRPIIKECSEFLYLCIISPYVQNLIWNRQVGANREGLSKKVLELFEIPLPPLEEQKRIVEKVEQLMLLCDQLEKQKDRKNDLVSKINNAAINKLVQAKDEQALKNAWQFIQHQFETIFTDKKNVIDLKEVILNLSMRGKLATHNSNDIPASVTLKEIIKEKKQLIKDKKIANQKELPAISTTEKEFELPNGWEWVRLNDFGTWKSGSTPSRSNLLFYDGNIPWVKSGEVKQGKIKFTSENITELALEKCSLHINPIGSVLIAMYGANIGETGVLEIEAATNQAVCACKTYSAINNHFLHLLLQSLKSNFISQGAGAAQPNISREKIIHTVVPLPPVNEQARIVKKVEELFNICDLLEKKIDQSTQKQVQILDAVLAQL